MQVETPVLSCSHLFIISDSSKRLLHYSLLLPDLLPQITEDNRTENSLKTITFVVFIPEIVKTEDYLGEDILNTTTDVRYLPNSYQKEELHWNFLMKL